jgi:hypothetical protein
MSSHPACQMQRNAAVLTPTVHAYCTLFAGDCAITSAARRSRSQQRGLLQSITPASLTRARSNNRNARRNNNVNNPLGGASNPLGSIIDAVRGGGGGSSGGGGGSSGGGGGGGSVTPAAQQTLRCQFDSLNSKVEIRYTAVGSVVGTWTNVATVTFTGGQPKKDSVPVTVVSSQAHHKSFVS